MRSDIKRVIGAERRQYWGSLCLVCGINISVMQKYDILVYSDNSTEKVMSWQSNICKCRYSQTYRNGVNYERLPGDPVYDKMWEVYQTRVKNRGRSMA